MGYSRAEYRQALGFVFLVQEHHDRASKPRSQWSLPAHVGRAISDPFIDSATSDLDGRLESEATPELDRTASTLDDAKASLEYEESTTDQISTPESGTAYTPAEAAARVHQLDQKIEDDEKVGKHHHRRAPAALKKFAPYIPWVEFFGFLFFIGVWLNVPILQPQRDFGAWTLSVALVLAIILGQTWLVHHAGTSHNHAREATAENNRLVAERAFTRRNWYAGIAVTTVTAAIAAGMVLRGIMSLGAAGLATTIFIIFVAIVAGYGMLMLSFLAIARDGSKVSRERDHLVVSLDDDLAEDQQTIADIQADLADVDQAASELRTSTFPHIIETTQTVADGAYRVCSLVWLLLGGLNGEEPTKSAPSFGVDEATNKAYGRIGVTIPGADKVDLAPLFTRAERLASLRDERDALGDRLAKLPAHPWSAPRF